MLKDVPSFCRAGYHVRMRGSMLPKKETKAAWGKMHQRYANPSLAASSSTTADAIIRTHEHLDQTPSHNKPPS